MQVLSKIPPIESPLIPPQGSVPAGVSPDGKQLYTFTRKMVTSTIPRTNEQGGEIWLKNPQSGEPLVKKRRPIVEEVTYLFYLEDQKNGQVELIPYRWPTEEEVRQQERDRKIAAVSKALPEMLVDRGVDLDKLMQMASGEVPITTNVPAPAGTVPHTVPTEPISGDMGSEEIAYPFMATPSRWTLSDGRVVVGKRVDAEREEAQVTEEDRAAYRALLEHQRQQAEASLTDEEREARAKAGAKAREALKLERAEREAVPEN